MGYLSYLLLSFGIFVLFTARRRRRKRRAAASLDALDWPHIAEALFERHAERVPPVADRLHQAVTATLRQLDLSYGLITVQDGAGHGRVLHLSSRGYAPTPHLWTGKEIRTADFLCGTLGAGREQIAVDIVSLSGWRNHPGYTQQGWETFIGVARPLGDGRHLVLTCFDTRPRDRLYHSREKQFLQQVTTWVASTLERSENAWLSSADQSAKTGAHATS